MATNANENSVTLTDAQANPATANSLSEHETAVTTLAMLVASLRSEIETLRQTAEPAAQTPPWLRRHSKNGIAGFRKG
ncbi:hypothetical protein [Sphingomonas sp. 8AM]|uniref:hypothetical protein n=1 Tax=Sphingomonas sp. 8AM TaxID=2653170 RepID=UPI0012EEEF7C|nr:hypothetical protein [Sphingomonas sp. 8AM]VXD00603.1 hypothetical protein SPHINGO8AM_70216 [Sphingomonas sp. 8AM]